ARLPALFSCSHKQLHFFETVRFVSFTLILTFWLTRSKQFTPFHCQRITYTVYQCHILCNSVYIPYIFTLSIISVFQLLDASVSLKAIHSLVILYLVVGLLASFLGSATTCLNSVNNPYLTFLGPLGVYVWSSISCGFVLLGIIFFASNTELNDMPLYIANVLDASNDRYYRNENTYGYSFWLLLLTIFLNIATVGVIYYYQHARYTKKEAHRPLCKTL
uniref:Clarin 3 n=1 Tax=Leptobrachium leishanense TaxID=445787 RepID=A0A8C5QBW1_9ANUR